jgi:hypothetical protein
MNWVSVKDKHPPANENFPSDIVLIYCSNGKILLGYWHKGEMHEQCSNCRDGSEITYWMPLPQPPEDK